MKLKKKKKTTCSGQSVLLKGLSDKELLLAIMKCLLSLKTCTHRTELGERHPQALEAHPGSLPAFVLRTWENTELPTYS